MSSIYVFICKALQQVESGRCGGVVLQEDVGLTDQENGEDEIIIQLL